MIYLFWVFAVTCFTFYFFLRLGWEQIPYAKPKVAGQAFSVIIPVRNEELVIQSVLNCLQKQRYPKDKFEVIIVDDFSEDKTRSLVKEYIKKADFDLRLIALENPLKSGKKYALTAGIEAAKFDYILTTDADCEMGPDWIASYARLSDENRFIAGPVRLSGSGIFPHLQKVEFAGLIGFGAVTMENNDPSMCSGANLGFSKQAFHEVGGYQDNIDIPSGDDEFLLYKILSLYPGKASFIKSKQAVVTTKAHTSLRQFINQRVRWTSKWKYNRNWKLKLLAILFFLDHFLFVILLFGMLIGTFLWQQAGIILLLRMISSYVFLFPLNRFFNIRYALFPVLALQIIYPIHVLFMGVNSIFGNYTWKGRKY